MSRTLRLVLPHGLLLVATALLYWAATGIQASTGGGRIGPDAWPKAIIVVMGLLCAWEIARRLAVRPRVAMNSYKLHRDENAVLEHDGGHR